MTLIETLEYEASRLGQLAEVSASNGHADLAREQDKRAAALREHARRLREEMDRPTSWRSHILAALLRINGGPVSPPETGTPSGGRK